MAARSSLTYSSQERFVSTFSPRFASPRLLCSNLSDVFSQKRSSLNLHLTLSGMSSLMSSSFAAMTPFCGQYAPLTASAKWSLIFLASLSLLAFEVVASLSSLVLACLAPRVWPLLLYRCLGEGEGTRFYCQLCLHSDYIIIVNNFFVSNYQVFHLRS